MEENKFKRYNRKCTLFCLRLRNEKDEKYINFLNNCPNRAEFIRDAIDKALAE